MKFLKKLFLAVVLSSFLVMLMACNEANVFNSEKTFKIISAWERNGIVNHYNGGTNIGPLNWFAVEGLYTYVRSTDEIVPQLADGLMDHTSDTETLIHIKTDAKWQNGDDFVADDIIAFYYLNHTVATNYMLSVTKVDDKTIKITWNQNRLPVNEVKELLIAQDRQGTVQYNEFKTFADNAIRIVNESPSIPDNSTTWGAFNKFSTTAQIAELQANSAAYRAHNPSWFVATGPFKIDRVTPTQMILVKNKLHWAADIIEFEKIEVYSSSDLNQTYNMLASGTVHYQDGLAPIDTLNAILNQNKNLVHLKMFDPGAIGILFNLEKEIWTPKVREAFQYIFNREEVKNAGNPYGVTSWSSLLGMAPSEAQRWIGDYYNQIETYEFDLNKAAQLLTDAGWSKVGNAWHRNGEAVKLYMGVDQNHPGQSGAAEAAQAALNAFGIETVLLKTDNSNWTVNSRADDSPYDLSVHWTDLNMSFSYPTGSLKMFADSYSRSIHIPRFPIDMMGENGQTSPLAGRVNLTFADLANPGKTIQFSEVVDILYSLNGERLTDVVGSIVVGMSQQNFGIQFYQNVTGSFIDVSMIDGVPLQSYWSVDRNVTYVPGVNTQDFFDVAKTNLHYAQSTVFITGIYQPTKEKN